MPRIRPSVKGTTAVIERLEERRMLAAGAVIIANGVLQVTGTPGDDNIRFFLLPGNKNTLAISIDDGSGNPPTIETMDMRQLALDVKRVVVDGGAGSSNNIVVDETYGKIRLSFTIFGGPGNDTIVGGSGNDVLIGGGGDDSIVAGSGNDVIIGDGPDNSAGAVTATFPGNDTIVAGSGNCTINAGDGNNTITLGRGPAAVYAGVGSNTITCGNGNAFIQFARGGTGQNSVFGGNGSDTILGGDGGDYLEAGRKSSIIYGGNGNDTIIGGPGNDQLYGGLGDDYIDGGAGNDSIDGGGGNDTLIGGPGKNVFHIGPGNTRGEVVDFHKGDRFGPFRSLLYSTAQPKAHKHVKHSAKR